MDMIDETITIPITRYRDEDGHPTCAANFTKGRFCRFLLTRKLGLVEVCGLSGKDLPRREEGAMSLKPVDECPVWADCGYAS